MLSIIVVVVAAAATVFVTVGITDFVILTGVVITDFLIVVVPVEDNLRWCLD